MMQSQKDKNKEWRISRDARKLGSNRKPKRDISILRLHLK
jgi:hypothetical protein